MDNDDEFITIEGQVIASTALDSQGERTELAILQKLEMKRRGARVPLHRNHDMSLPVVGHLENYRLVHDPSVEGEWKLVADVHLKAGADLPPEGGFSWSLTTRYRRNCDVDTHAETSYFLPYPHYNDDLLVEDLLKLPRPIEVGKWLKKELSPEMVGLLATMMMMIASPMWKKVFDEKIWPSIEPWIPSLETLLARGLATHLLIPLSIDGREVQLYIIPPADARDLSQPLLEAGIESAISHVRIEAQRGRSVVKLRMRYSLTQDSFELLGSEDDQGNTLATTV